MNTNIDLDTEVCFLRGVGPRRAEFFERLGVRTAGDLLEHYPRDYEFYPPMILMAELLVSQNVTIAGRILNMRYNRRSRPPRFDIVLADDTGQCRLTWFHGGYLSDRFIPGDTIAAWGKVSRYKGTLQMVNPHWKKVEAIEELLEREGSGGAIYRAGGDLSSPEISRVVRNSLDQLVDLVEEYFDDDYLQKRQMPSRQKAFRWVHCPADKDQIPHARRRLAYDELFLMELGIALRRERTRRSQNAYAMRINEKIDKRIRRLFEFELTPDQDKVVAEICDDLTHCTPMNRLLQGDVGSGKTVVALYAALVAVGNGRQVAIMTPTEVLAEQHFLSIEKYLAHSRVKRMLLRGGLSGSKRQEVMSQISTGQVDIVVGTQALLSHDVAFDQLALVVIDEQHKFGVRQRQLIRCKDVAPHCLVMTATPIPRTLTLTVFGDLDVSTIKHLPPGRRKVVTRWVEPEKLPRAYEFIREKVSAGQQAYFVYPRVEDEFITDDSNEHQKEAFIADGDSGCLKAAIGQAKYLQDEVFAEFKVGLLHGQMDRQSKQTVMADFRNHKIDILVATVVIEVGVDVPNATIMVIEHADRFGLAQLHQLRGRIGRGSKASFCLLFGQGNTEAACDRLKIMASTSDGFRIAEEDLRIRGPGEMFGTSQHGLPDLKIANLLEDIDLLRLARRDAFALVKNDPRLKDPSNAALRIAILKRFGNDLGLVDVG